ncbi:MAG: hypothetical protein J6Y16_01390 [Treponema sp.]|nr:hypothetical protein [Treponema sp.]
MKKILFSLLILLSVVNVYAKDSLFEITDDNAPLYYYGDKQQLPAKEYLDFVGIDDNEYISVNGYLNQYMYYVNTNSNYCHIPTDYLIPKDTDDLIPVEAQTKPNDEYVWMSEFFLELVKTRNANVLRAHYPCRVELMGEGLEYKPSWKSVVINEIIITNCVIQLELSTFYVENISLIENGFKVETTVYEMDEDMCGRCNPKISTDIPHILYFIFDGDFMTVYIDNMNTMLQKYVRIPASCFTNIDEYLEGREKLIASKDFTWPHHADGTSEYEAVIREPSFKYPWINP